MFLLLLPPSKAERDRIRERVTQVKQDQRRRRRYFGGRPPHGYRIGQDGDLKPVSAQREAIRHALELRAADTPLRAIRDVLKEKHSESISLDALARLSKGVADLPALRLTKSPTNEQLPAQSWVKIGP